MPSGMAHGDLPWNARLVFFNALRATRAMKLHVGTAWVYACKFKTPCGMPGPQNSNSQEETVPFFYISTQ